MESNTALWILFWFISSSACYLYGMYVESKLNPKQKPNYSELKLEEEKSEIHDTNDDKLYKEELDKERASKRKMTQEYEKEIDSLKAQIAFIQAQTKEKLAINNQKYNQQEELFDEAPGFSAPIVQIVDGSYDNFDEDLNKELNNEI
ncbi:unnamed protein product [Blepharisma stoltei]|uniref:Uncharacterized protein n=1 Tax=Blepharisma stoltei TaxID=1481888 RepID=A0AAU9K434_9CILI|nr:unnamed protein product [Blepharisma stoltei]